VQERDANQLFRETLEMLYLEADLDGGVKGEKDDMGTCLFS
jgi:hypothetical protein